MTTTREPIFTFVSSALSKDTFTVVNFKGKEALSYLFHFEINVVATDKNIDLKDVVKKPATFTIHGAKGEVPFHGILSQFELHQDYRDYAFYKAVLTPRLWWLTLGLNNQIFLQKSIKDIIGDVLKGSALTSNDYEMRLQGSYSTLDYVCQYRQSPFDFISHWMERDGIYYFFDHSGSQEKMILTDSKSSHTQAEYADDVYYSPPSGLDHGHREEIVSSLVCRQRMIPEKVVMNDYYYMKPTLALKAEETVYSEGKGEFYEYGRHYQQPGEGTNLAKIRKEGFLCREQVFTGESTIPYFVSGYTYKLQDHFRDAFNQEYVLTDIQHQGAQTSYLVDELRNVLPKANDRILYHNVFTAIPKDIQFRAEAVTPKSRFYGTMHAKVDASGSGKYAELDEHGRYKVILPFDVSGRSGGKASAWLRMMQPYGGDKHGMHFPLIKDTEVLITFIDGDPDRPVISGATPNPEHASVVTSKEQNTARITTLGQNKLHFYDQDNKQRIHLECPTEKTKIIIGDKDDDNVEKGITITTEGQLNEKIKDKMVIEGQSTYDKTIKDKITIEGKNDYQKTIKGGVTIEVDKDYSKTVKKDYTKEIKGEAKTKISKDRKLNVSGNNKVSVSKNYKLTVMGKMDATVMKDSSRTIMGAEKLTAMKASSHTYIKDYQLMVAGHTKHLLNKVTNIKLGKHMTILADEEINIDASKKFNIIAGMLLALKMDKEINMNMGDVININLGTTININAGNTVNIGQQKVEIKTLIIIL